MTGIFSPVDWPKALRVKINKMLLPPQIEGNPTLKALVQDARVELVKNVPDPLRCQALVEQINRIR